MFIICSPSQYLSMPPRLSTAKKVMTPGSSHSNSLFIDSPLSPLAHDSDVGEVPGQSDGSVAGHDTLPPSGLDVAFVSPGPIISDSQSLQQNLTKTPPKGKKSEFSHIL